jgi:hypothetical protein
MGVGSSLQMPIGVVHWGWLTHATVGRLFCVLNQTHFMAFKSKKEFLADVTSALKIAMLALPVWDLVATADVEGIEAPTIFVVKTSERMMVFKTAKANEVMDWLNAIKRLLKIADLSEQRKQFWEEKKKLLLHCFIVEAMDVEEPNGKKYLFSILLI